MDDVLNNLDKQWNWHYMARNPNFTINIVLKSTKLKCKWDWNWEEILCHLNVTMKDIINIIRVNQKLEPWHVKSISKNPNLTIDCIIQHPNLKWDWAVISHNPNITIEDITNHSDKPWNWYNISKNQNITMDFILANPDKSWNWENITLNSKININRYRHQ